MSGHFTMARPPYRHLYNDKAFFISPFTMVKPLYFVSDVISTISSFTCLRMMKKHASIAALLLQTNVFSVTMQKICYMATLLTIRTKPLHVYKCILSTTTMTITVCVSCKWIGLVAVYFVGDVAQW